MITDVGLLKSSDVDGSYGSKTTNAVILFQQWVNQEKGSQVLEVSGICDALTLQYLEYCSDKGYDIGGATATEVPTQVPSEVPTEVPTQAPTQVPTEAPTQVPTEAPTQVPTEAPTQVPTEAPTEVPSVGTVQNFRIAVDGMVSDGSLIEVPEGGSVTVQWAAEGDVESYYVYLYDGDNQLVNSADAVQNTEMPVSSKTMTPGMTYTLRVGAMPVNGGKEDVVWQTLLLLRPITATPEPTAEPTAEPTRTPSVSTPVLNIGSSVYQENGVTYVSGDKIIFSWNADGDVDHYIATLRYEDGSSYSLGSTNDTSKTVDTDYLRSLKPAGMWQLEIGAVAIGASDDDAMWNTLTFGVPGTAASETPEPEVPSDPTDTTIRFIDASSDPNDIRSLQVALYGYNLIDTDAMQEGVLDAATLQAVSNFQIRVNELYGTNLYVIDPYVDAYVDEATLDLLLYQKPNLNP